MTFSVYSKSGCPYCVKVEQVLKLAEVKYVIYKLDTDYTREQFYNQFGVGSTFPEVSKRAKLSLNGTTCRNFK